MRDEYPGHRTLRDGVVPWTWDVGLGIAPDDGLPLYGPGFVLFASVENAACIYHSGHGTRALYYDYVVSFNLVNCPSKTFSPIYAIHCPLSFFHPRIFFYPSTLSLLYYIQFRPVEYLQPRTPQANLDFLTNPGLPRKLLLCILCLSGLCFSLFLLLFVTVILVCLCCVRASSGKKN